MWRENVGRRSWTGSLDRMAKQQSMGSRSEASNYSSQTRGRRMLLRTRSFSQKMVVRIHVDKRQRAWSERLTAMVTALTTSVSAIKIIPRPNASGRSPLLVSNVIAVVIVRV